MYHDVDFACSLHNLTNPRERILKKYESLSSLIKVKWTKRDRTLSNITNRATKYEAGPQIPLAKTNVNRYVTSVGESNFTGS